MLTVFRYSDLMGITIAILRRFRELAWIGLGLICLALTGGRSLATQEGLTREPG